MWAHLRPAVEAKTRRSVNTHVDWMNTLTVACREAACDFDTSGPCGKKNSGNFIYECKKCHKQVPLDRYNRNRCTTDTTMTTQQWKMLSLVDDVIYPKNFSRQAD